METTIQLYSGNDIRPIDRIEFGILSNNEIRSRSALDSEGIGIETPELYENNEPKKGGLVDPRMGTTDSSVDCATCNFNSTYCPGHSSHISLAEPVFHMGYLPYVKVILDIFCPRCSKPLIGKDNEDFKRAIKSKRGVARALEISKIVKSVKYCQKENYGCGTPVPQIKLDVNKNSQIITVIAEHTVDTKEEGQKENGKRKVQLNLSAANIYNIFKNINDDDFRLVGFNPERGRPETLLVSTMFVPPVTVRSSAKGDFLGGAMREDDLTHVLGAIVKANIKALKQKESSGPNAMKYMESHTNLLQIKVAHFYDIKKISKSNTINGGKPFRSLVPRLTGKHGRIRGNLQGKRGDFTARSVITSDPNIDFNELGVPLHIAMIVTYPEIVGPSNIDELTKLVKRGRDEYPGANFVFPMSMKRQGFKGKILPIDLRYRKEKIRLRYGDIVERHIQTGDVVLFNRQPTLHMLSMMCHKVKVIKDPTLMTFRMSVSTTAPYNADFDGDLTKSCRQQVAAC